MNKDILNKTLQKATTLDLFPGHLDLDPSLICISFPDALSIEFLTDNEFIYPGLMKLYPEFGNCIIIEVIDDKITLKIPDKLGNILVTVNDLSFNTDELKRLNNRINNAKTGNYELIIGAKVMGIHNTLRDQNSKLFFTSCIINNFDE